MFALKFNNFFVIVCITVNTKSPPTVISNLLNIDYCIKLIVKVTDLVFNHQFRSRFGKMQGQQMCFSNL